MTRLPVVSGEEERVMRLEKAQAAQHAGAVRRGQLVAAAIAAIAEHGLSHVTLAKVAAGAGLSAASVNFHFTSKEALLLATLRQLGEDFDAATAAALELGREDPAAGLLALIDVMLDAEVAAPAKVAVWYAFIAESRARADYLQVCGDLDRRYVKLVSTLFARLFDDSAAGSEFGPQVGPESVDAKALAGGLVGLLESQWQEILFAGEAFDRTAARDLCRAYLASVCPARFDMPARHGAAPATEGVGGVAAVGGAAERPLVETLPAWTYENDEFFALERERVFLPAWQIVGHVSDLPETGDYVTFELLGERAFVIRGRDGELRAFHNVCRHRAHAVVTGERGTCKRAIACPYHGWTYDLDGRLKGVPAAETFAPFDKTAYGLKALDLEVYLGLVFVRFVGGGPSVAERLAPYTEELSRYRFEDMVAIDEMWSEPIAVDWKNAMDNYLEDYHFTTGHPGLAALMERDYDREVSAGGASRLSHRMKDDPQRFWSVRQYRKLLPAFAHLPEELRRRWTYVTLFPNVNLDVLPDKMDFFQFLPLGPGRCILHGRTYALPDDALGAQRRESRAARYLSHRINWRVQDEDNALTLSVQGGLRSSAYDVGLLSDKEVVVKGLHDWIRERLPVARLHRAPPAGSVARHNRERAARPGG
jgi:phenylpropionate dioxygenase-like ring-hydroxylating dioxygenase large terminal subunit/AcrR family transcriptional regulator